MNIEMGRRAAFRIEGRVIYREMDPTAQGDARDTVSVATSGGAVVEGIPILALISNQSIDWDAPLEAYHPDGRVVAVELRKGKIQPDKDGDYSIEPVLDGGCHIFHPDGSHWAGGEWRIRNRVIEMAGCVTREQAERLARRGISRDMSPDLVDRMVRLVRDLAGRDDSIGDDARDIAALLPPEPVDPDAALARKLCDNSTFDLADDKIYELVKTAIRAGRESAHYQSGRKP